MNTNERLTLFANELNDIQDNNLRQFAIQLLVNAPDYFFTIPASSTGQNHPYFAREIGGLVKHTRCVIIKKQGNDASGYTVWEHPELAHNYILDMQKSYPDLISVEDATIIANAILSHMGKWQHDEKFVKNRKQFPLPTTLFEYAIQSADYIASRVELTGFAFRPTDGVSITNNL